MPKDVVLPEIAEWYRKRGFTALIFDTYGIGSSDGEPRCDVSLPNFGVLRRAIWAPADPRVPVTDRYA